VRVSEGYFRSLVQSASDTILVLDRNGSIRYISPSVEWVLGRRPEDLVDNQVDDFNLVHPDDIGRLQSAIADSLNQPGTSVANETRLLHADGSWRHMESVLVNALDDQLVGGLIVNSRDITERKRSEEKLWQSEERFRAQYESFPTPTFSWRRAQDDFELVDYNEAADKITRGRLSGLLGMRASEWYADEPQILGMLSRCFGEGTTIQQEISWRLRTTGEHKYFTVTFAYVPPDLVIHYAEDITERKRAEQALEESHTLLRSVIEGTPDVVFLKDTLGRYMVANSSAAKVFGKPVQELLGKDNTEFMPVEVARRIMEVDRQVMDTEESRVGEERLSVQGISKTYLFTKAPYRDHRGEVAGVIGTAHDITERKSAEEALRQTKERFHSLVRYSSDLRFTERWS